MWVLDCWPECTSWRLEWLWPVTNIDGAVETLAAQGGEAVADRSEPTGDGGRVRRVAGTPTAATVDEANAGTSAGPPVLACPGLPELPGPRHGAATTCQQAAPNLGIPFTPAPPTGSGSQGGGARGARYRRPAFAVRKRSAGEERSGSVVTDFRAPIPGPRWDVQQGRLVLAAEPSASAVRAHHKMWWSLESKGHPGVPVPGYAERQGGRATPLTE